MLNHCLRHEARGDDGGDDEVSRLEPSTPYEQFPSKTGPDVSPTSKGSGRRPDLGKPDPVRGETET